MPCVKDIGLWGERLQRAYVDMGVFEMGDANLDLLMAQDEEIAEQLDAERFAAEEAARTAEVADAIAEGETPDRSSRRPTRAFRFPFARAVRPPAPRRPRTHFGVPGHLRVARGVPWT